VLSVAPLEVEWEPSLEDYAAQTHDMGPVVQAAEDSSGTEALPAEEVDAYFTAPDADADAGDGSAAGGTITTETELGEGEGSTSGGGAGGQENAPPVIASMTVEDLGDTIRIWGQISDDTNPANYAVTFSGLITESINADEYGYFQIEVPKPTTSGFIVAVATDTDGSNSEEFRIFYDPE